MISKPNDTHEETDRCFQSTLRAAMISLGWLLPETEAELQATCQEDDSQGLELPHELTDPLAALDRHPKPDHSRVA